MCKQINDPIVVLGWKGEVSLLKNRFESNVRVTFLEDALLPALVQYIVSAQLFIAVDSFPLHIADAYGTNFIGFLARLIPKRFNRAQRALFIPVKIFPQSTAEYYQKYYTAFKKIKPERYRITLIPNIDNHLIGISFDKYSGNFVL